MGNNRLAFMAIALCVLFASCTGAPSSTDEPSVERFYLYKSDPMSNEIITYSTDGESGNLYVIPSIPRNVPYFCTYNSSVYYCDDTGIHRVNIADSSDDIVLEGDYSQLKVVGGKLYFVKGNRLSDGCIYSCELDGSDLTVLVDDERMKYGKDDVVQNVSYILDDGMLYYVAKNKEEDYAGTIVEHQPGSATLRELAVHSVNVELMGLCDVGLAYRTWDRKTGRTVLFVLDFEAGVSSEVDVINHAIIYGEKLFYSKDSGIYQYDGSGVQAIYTGPVSLLYAFNNNLYFNNAHEPYTVLDLMTHDVGTMPEGFEDVFLPMSYEDKTAANVSYT